MFKVGLIGVPIETIAFEEEGIGPFYLDCFLPKITDELRSDIYEELKRNNSGKTDILDMGELFPDKKERPNYSINRKEGIPALYMTQYTRVKTADLENERPHIKKLYDECDLLVALGPSHLGGLPFYEENDNVARFDYHADFCNDKYPSYGYANYMDWVKKNINKIEVNNYFVKYMQKDLVFKSQAEISSGLHKSANFFDIDVDCVDEEYLVQRTYPHTHGATGVSPNDIVNIISDARPKKIGFFEYRMQQDANMDGYKMIINSIQSQIDKNRN